MGHLSHKCYLQNKVEARLNPIVASGSGTIGQVTCFQCGKKGHMTQNCQKPPQGTVSNDNQSMSGNEVRRMDSSRPTVSFLYSVGCVNREHSDYITLELDERQGYKLHFLVDSRADTLT